MDSNSKSKGQFILDCCNKNQSTLKTYNSQQDIYLAGYFALKKKRGVKFGSKTTRSMKQKLLDNPGPSAYLQSPLTLKHSLSNNSIRQRNFNLDYLSSSQFKNLIQKYRLSP